MDAAIYGLIGTLLGGLITIIVTNLSNRKDVKLKQLEFEAQRAEANRISQRNERDRRIEQYVAFLGAYRQVQGAVVDIVLLLEHRPEKWKATMNEIVDSKEFTDAICKLNEGVAWIGLLSSEETAHRLAGELSTAHDAVFTELRRAKNVAMAGQELSLDDVNAKRAAADAIFEQLFLIIRKETKAVQQL